jgi:hypothetical protein
MKRLCAGLLTLLLSPAVLADGPAGPRGFLDLYYVPDASWEISASDPCCGSIKDDVDGDGFGARFLAPAGQAMALSGEYQKGTYEDGSDSVDVDRLRLGLGVIGASASGVFVEYDKLEISDDSDSFEMDGYAIRGRLNAEVAPRISIHGDLGYAMLTDDDDDDWKGPEFAIGAAFGITDAFGVMVDYRITRLETTFANPTFGTETEFEFEFTDLRVGGRLAFGG